MTGDITAALYGREMAKVIEEHLERVRQDAASGTVHTDQAWERDLRARVLEIARRQFDAMPGSYVVEVGEPLMGVPSQPYRHEFGPAAKSTDDLRAKLRWFMEAP